MSNQEPSPTYCVLPWMHLALNSTGYIRLCCNSTPGKNIFLDNNNQKVHISKVEDLELFKDSKWINDIRKKMLNGERVDICQRCYREEDAGMRSARQGWNIKHQKHIEASISSTREDGSTDYYEGAYIDLRLGNLCNLKCRMCNPYASKKWLEDWNQVYADKALPEKESTRLDRLDWYKDEKTWDLLCQLGDQAEEIYFTGGEPFLISSQNRLLDYLISTNQSGKTKLKYNTNLTVLPEKIIEKWGHFKGVTLNISIDAVGELNDYIRNPSNWQDIEDNLHKVDQLIDQNPRLRAYVHTTVQAYNINKVSLIPEYLRKFKNIQHMPYWNILDHPDHLNIKALPKDFKANVADEMNKWLEQQEPFCRDETDLQSVEKLKEVSRYMMMDDWSHLSQKFCDSTSQLDEIRSESLQNVNPDIYSAFYKGDGF